MLSALVREEPLDMSNIDYDSASTGGFGKMLNSLQGLQQRLEDFSIADVANAEANAQTLILRLKQVHSTIASVALLKQASADIDRSVGETAQADLAAIELDSLASHPQLHAIVNAGKLIKLHKLMTALKAGALAGDKIESQARQNGSEEPDTDKATVAHDEIAAHIGDPEIAESMAADCLDLGAPTTTPTPEPPATSAQEMSSTPDGETDEPLTGVESSEPLDDSAIDRMATSEFPTAEAEFETAIAATHVPSSPVSSTLTEDFPAPENLTAARTPVSQAEVSLPLPVESKDIAKSAPQDKKKSAANGTNPIDASMALVPANERFDLRLLDDLVSNYGEFATNPNLPATRGKSQIQNFVPASEKVESAQPVQADAAETAPLPARSNGELDRQLKKIIKDYGEYDLYSDKPAANLKKAGIIAFVFLGLVFGGIYFFKTPPSTAKTVPPASNSDGVSTVSEDKPQAAAAPTGTPAANQSTAKN